MLKINKGVVIAFLAVSIILVAAAFYKYGGSIWEPIYTRITGGKTVPEAINKVKPDADNRLRPKFENAGLEYLSGKLTFLAFKREKTLELWAEKDQKQHFVKSYKVLAASGALGPKLKEGDRQVPEGIYKIIGMNPNSRFHLSMLINYPNEFDKKKALLDKRTNLGGEICIHGKDVSIGCIAVGDEAIEELFAAVGKVTMQNVKVIISPYDFRKDGVIDNKVSDVPWVSELYDLIEKEVKEHPIPSE